MYPCLEPVFILCCHPAPHPSSSSSPVKPVNLLSGQRKLLRPDLSEPPPTNARRGVNIVFLFIAHNLYIHQKLGIEFFQSALNEMLEGGYENLLVEIIVRGELLVAYPLKTLTISGGYWSQSVFVLW